MTIPSHHGYQMHSQASEKQLYCNKINIHGWVVLFEEHVLEVKEWNLTLWTSYGILLWNS